MMAEHTMIIDLASMGKKRDEDQVSHFCSRCGQREGEEDEQCPVEGM